MDELAIAADLVSADWSAAEVVEGGESHRVVVLPGVAAVRIARTEADSQDLARRTALVDAVAPHVPFAVPEALGDVRWYDGTAAVATAYVAGAPHPAGWGDARVLRDVLDALRALDVDALAPLLAPPHAYAREWTDDSAAAVVASLPPRVRDEARRRLDAVRALPRVAPSFVHGDLAGHNMRWEGDRLVGVIDWDLASGWDPAVDVAALSAWHGAGFERVLADRDTAERASAWRKSFPLELIARKLAGPAEGLAAAVERVTRALD